MTPRLTRYFPVWAFACTMSRKAARLTAENRKLRKELATVRAELAVANTDRAALKAHFDLAVDQRERARDLAAAMGAEPSRHAEDFEAWERSGNWAVDE